jgi:hypothetical protein
MWLYGDDKAASPLKPPADNTEPLEGNVLGFLQKKRRELSS